MKLEEIDTMWNEDCIINDAKLDEESLKIPKLHAKYHNILNYEKMQQYKLKKDLEELEYIYERFFAKTLTDEEIAKYNLVEFCNKKYMKNDIPKAINSVDVVVKMKSKLGIQNIKVEFIESILKQINNRNWLIRDAIEFKKFSNGGY